MKSEVSLLASIGYSEVVTNPRQILLQLYEIQRLDWFFEGGTVPGKAKTAAGGRLPFPKRRKEDEMKRSCYHLLNIR
ncbi:MAG: hypothetical protein LUC39_02240 [Clostridiales bacterium]|nr:hypothetical protein [Clostridiales bacterium]